MLVDAMIENNELKILNYPKNIFKDKYFKLEIETVKNINEELLISSINAENIAQREIKLNEFKEFCSEPIIIENFNIPNREERNAR